MATQYDQANWTLTRNHPRVTILFFEPVGIAAVYLAIYRVTNDSDVDVTVITARGQQIVLPGFGGTRPSSVDVSSTMLTIEAARPLEQGERVIGTYQDICCSLAQSTATFHTTVYPPDTPLPFDPLTPPAI
jgi:hypothetical protein